MRPLAQIGDVFSEGSHQVQHNVEPHTLFFYFIYLVAWGLICGRRVP